MLTVRVRLVEFMDSTPFAACRIRVEARVIAAWQGRLDIDEPERPGRPPRAVPRPPPGGGSVPVLEYDDERAISVLAEATTDAQGRATLQLDLGAAFRTVRRLKRNNQPPELVEAQLAAGADIHGLDLPARYRFEAVAQPDAERDVVLVADVARSIVGDTSASHARLWFQLHAPLPAGDRLICVLQPAGGAERRIGLRLEADRAHTANVLIDGLQAETAHRYVLHLVKPDSAERPLTRGRFRTLPADPRRLTLAFGSCHLPGPATALNRWHALAARQDIDLVFLIGDQIYGDGIDRIFPAASWKERFERRYTQLWNYQPVREVLRSRPHYMALDDHEVVDDWGTEPVAADREAAGLLAYRTFQQAHNPGGADASVLDYGFRRGPAAFYVSDSRTARGKDPAFPVLGQAQLQRIQRWADSAEVRQSDLVFMVVPVPPGILPIAQLEKLAGLLAPVAGAAGGSLLGAIAGATIGLVVGGPAGAAAGAAAGAQIGAFVGAIGTKAYYEHVEDTITEPDIRDAWTYDKNLPDLVRLLDLLFDLANDIGADGQPGPRPRGVFILSGDYHFGALHVLRSTRTGGGHDHRRNPTMVQITSSPISKPAIDTDKLMTAAAVVSSGGEFKLDGAHYRSRFVDHLEQRNFGRVVFEHVAARRYRLQLYVEGEHDAIAEMFELDLDARPVQMRNLVGELLSARGRITLLRVQDSGGYGPSTDRIDGEVVVALDNEPGRAFGFQLRPGAALPVRRRMLAVLRDAFRLDRPVAIDYLRTGRHNGTLIRVAELPAPAAAPLPGPSDVVMR